MNTCTAARIFSIGALALSAQAALAQDMVLYATPGYLEGLRTKQMMHDIDANHDGMVSREEWAAYQGRVFDALDKDKDGYLEPNEFFRSAGATVIPFATAGFTHGLMTEQMFGKIDANGDGKVSKDEFLSYQLKIFDMLDQHKRQQLDVADFILKK